MDKKISGMFFIKGLDENIADKAFTDKKKPSLILFDGAW